MALLKNILDVQITTREQLKEINNQDDMVSLSLYLMIIHLAKLISSVGYKSLIVKPINKKETIETLAVVLENVMLFCNMANHDLDNEDLLDFEETEMALELKVDSVLCLMSMIGAVSNIAQTINIDLVKPIWDYESVPLDIEYDINTIVVGMKFIGLKHGFTLDDILAEVN